MMQYDICFNEMLVDQCLEDKPFQVLSKSYIPNTSMVAQKRMETYIICSLG